VGRKCIQVPTFVYVTAHTNLIAIRNIMLEGAWPQNPISSERFTVSIANVFGLAL